VSTVPAKDKKMIWLTVAWLVFFGGPGALLFNTPNYILGLPALWTFSIVAWLIGIFLVWWFGYKSAISNVADYED
jgi:hypothetical protein